MGLLGSWDSVDDTYQFQAGQAIRIVIQFSFIPATGPTDDEIATAFTQYSNIQTSQISETLGPGSVFSPGMDSRTIVGSVQYSETAGQLRAEVYNVLSALAGSRISPLWNSNVLDIATPDTRSTLTQIEDAFTGTDSSGAGPQTSIGGFAVSTTLIVVFIAMAIIAVAFAVRKVA